MALSLIFIHIFHASDDNAFVRLLILADESQEKIDISKALRISIFNIEMGGVQNHCVALLPNIASLKLDLASMHVAV